MQNKIKLGKYRHNKTGHIYTLILVGEHTETGEKLVAYMPDKDYDEINCKGKVWARPLSMFIEEVETNGKKVQRFEFIG